MKRARKSTILGGEVTSVGVATEAAGRFSPLKTALGAIPAIYANRKVRLSPSLLKTLCRRTHLQETATIGDTIENLLSRIVALEMRFETSPGEVEELRRRSDLIRYVIIPSSNLVLRSFQQVHRYRSPAAAVG